MPLPLLTNEQVLHHTVANLFRGIMSVGGQLRVTNYRLLFDAHAINIRYEAIEISLAIVAEARPRNTLFVVPNGMLVRTLNGTDYKFVVWGRRGLIDLINSLAEQARNGNHRAGPT